jgi:hypothetical protein
LSKPRACSAWPKEQTGQEIPEFLPGLLEFTDFAVAFRYEAFPDFEADVDRQDCLDNVGRLLQHVQQILMQEMP